MDKVKAALTDFTSRSGHHDTTVHESVAPGVTHETVKPHQHEEINTAVDKEVHQDHYHRTVQPVHDRQVLPEQHSAKLGQVQHREFDHRDHEHTKSHLTREQAQFKDQQVVENTTQSRSVAPTVGGEHVHHHIHETIQPVVHKETIQPNVVHTTVPIHEVHHNKATHHETTALPAMTMDEFKKKGGSLTGREERYDEFEGVPKNIGSGTAGGFGHVRDVQGSHAHGASAHKHGDHHDTPNHAGLATGAATGAAATGLAHEKHQHDSTNHHHGAGGLATGATAGAAGAGLAHEKHHHDAKTAGQYGPSGSQGTSVDAGDRQAGVNEPTGNSHVKANMGSDEGLRDSELPKALTEDKSRFNPPTGQHDSTDTTTTGKKPSLMDKLNPKVDSNGDGKAGFLK